MWKEIRELRANFGGDKHAINRHSVRFYEWEGVGFFQLDRNMSCCPPCFELTDLYGDPRDSSPKCYIPPVFRRRSFVAESGANGN